MDSRGSFAAGDGNGYAISNLQGKNGGLFLTNKGTVTSLRLVAVNKSGKVIAASIWGKLKTVSQMVAITCVFLEPVIVTPYLHTPNYLISIIGLVFMMVTTIFSGVDYFVKFLK